MNASELVNELTHHGIQLWCDGDQLRAKAPKGIITPEITSRLKAEKLQIMGVLRFRLSRAESDDEDAETGEAIQEHLEERAAIMEYDGGLTRKQAETEARRNMRVYEYRLTDSPDSRLTMIAPGCDLEEARESLRKRFGDRLLDVHGLQRR